MYKLKLITMTPSLKIKNKKVIKSKSLIKEFWRIFWIQCHLLKVQNKQHHIILITILPPIDNNFKIFQFIKIWNKMWNWWSSKHKVKHKVNQVFKKWEIATLSCSIKSLIAVKKLRNSKDTNINAPFL